MKTIFIVCALFTIVQSVPKSSPVQDIQKELRQFLQNIDSPSIVDNETNVQTKESGCATVGYNYGCCLHLKVAKISLDDNVCVNLTYLPAPEYGFSLTMSIDKKVIINETVSAKNPPPVCADVPELKKLASICLKFSNMAFTAKAVSGCLSLEARLVYVVKEDIKIGCFKIPLPNHSNKASILP